MCLITGKRGYLIAKDDIIVWKVILLNNKSLIQQFQYKGGVEYKAPLEFVGSTHYDIAKHRHGERIMCADGIDVAHLRKEYNWNVYDDYDDRLIYIRKGFHSYAIKDRITNLIQSMEKVVECVIPKGSRYVLDDTGLCVSNRIIIKGI